MKRSPRSSHHILYFLCLAVLFLGGCSGGGQDQSASVPNQPSPSPNQPGPVPIPPGPGPTPPAPGPNPPGSVPVTGELLAGNPDFDGPVSSRPVDGQGVLADPPLNWLSLLFVGEKLVTHTQQEIWYTDLSVASPLIHRITGLETTGNPLDQGTCAFARLVNMRGLTLKTDGSIVGVDQTGNTVFAVSDSFGSNCVVSFLAGTTTSFGAVPRTVNEGDVDGPGVSARFAWLEWPTAIDGNIYVIDGGSEADGGSENTNKLKRIANDADHTVTTITRLPDGIYFGMTTLQGKLYAVGRSNSEGFIVQIDPATMAVHTIVRGLSSNISGLTTDGNKLYTYDLGDRFDSGHLLSVTRDGQVQSIELTPQPVVGFRTGIAGANVFLAFHNHAIYLSAKADGAYVLRIAIP